jgi:tetratricopeptide (TPR) repeat protein
VTASSLAVGILLLVSPQAGSRAATPLASRAVAPAPAVGPTFEELWASYVKADAAGDAERASAALGELRRTRIERNVWTLDTVGLALVERGVARLDESRREDAEEAFRTAVALAPGLPDGHAGLAVALLKKGPFGVVPSIDAAFSALAAFLPTGRGLLRHDMEEWLGPARSRSAALALLLLALLLPVATFQGWGWLPLWWLALLFAYFDGRERALALLVLGTTLAVGPLLWSLEFSLRTARNPLYSAALAAIESVPAPPEIGRLAEAARKDPEDRDLAYLLGAARRRAGRYEEAAEVYRRLLAADPGDPVARNNLANIEFVRGGYEAARAGYKAGTGPGAAPEVAATSYYNLSLVHLQKFEYQAYNEAKSNADRLAPGLVADYEQWKYDTGDYAVVDLGLTLEEVREKFAGSEVGVPHRNVAGTGAKAASRAGALAVSLLNRFTASLAVLALCALLVRRWRGPKAFTLHCGRCGTPFCRLCHLGQVSGGLCSQCYHLFVVRDGVSGPARNRKMGEVQGAEGRRDRVFRVLSVLSPGTGQIYGGWALRGAVLVAAWYGILGLLAAGRVVPLTEVPWRLSPPWLPWPFSSSGGSRTGSGRSGSRGCRRGRPAPGGPGRLRWRGRPWRSKGRSATSACPTSSSSSGCRGRPAS